ncbi:beta-ketoacyl synthase N-terminal-like domain-containing protein [Pelovirga terrestris]|uniref:Type I polyketide synthase n=1 Tax=Pelovirga terrestris TaxID=2771352 RepID=A0A8J6UN96_9BACT|nr:beta-ketoacyl synthase N-terminal-like domain-containing protein [Pelovirga terrestris]MBD1399134.1 type I polyketide synthase [Pelovirga terrestris]
MAYAQSVAVVAMGGEFPDAATLDDYWELILKKRNCARRPPAGRWLLPVEEIYHPEVGAADRVYSDKACFLADPAVSSDLPGLNIDAGFLRQLDPMFRLLLRVGQQTLTSAGTPSFDPSRAGVIIGNLALPSETSSALARQLLGKAFAEKLTDQPLSVHEDPIVPQNHHVAGLPAAVLARGLGFGGTCFTLDAACASSLYAIKLAVDELLSGRADLMLAGGVSRPDSLYTQMGFSQLRALSASGRCAPFDRSGNGLVVGEGCGLLLLKRTRDAQRDGDRILAVIRGIGLSNDLQGNLLAPSSEGQLRAMRAAYRQAGWQPSDVDLIECHATGTPVGDAVEFSSLQQLWGNSGWRSGQCVIGSVKANIGHLLTAAGAAASIKTILALSHRTLPPQTHFEQPAAGVDLDRSPFRLLGQACPWHQRRDEVPRRAAVSAFGFGGINAHMLLEEWQPERATRKKVTLHPSFSARQTPIAVVGLAAHYGPWSELQGLRQRFFGVDDKTKSVTPSHWWGGGESRWLQQIFPQGLPQGFCLGQIGAAAGEFRIPPNEIAEMLPRQLLMLKVAAAALHNADADHDDHLFTGVFIGCGLDHNATNFSFRWGLAQQARIWAQELGFKLTEDELSAWIAGLREAAGPALTANRTMGALGSVVASRIAREFGVGGPSFTISSEENSSLRALEVAIHALQEGSIKRALVGAVDLAADLRDVVCRQQLTPFSGAGYSRPLDRESQGIQLGEGAGALVLKRLEDARQDGDQIHAVVSGIGTAIGGAADQLLPLADVLRKAVTQACNSAAVKPADIGYLEVDGSGDPEADLLEAVTLSEVLGGGNRNSSCWLGSVKADIGHAGGAAGMAAVIKAVLCLKQRLLPPVRSLTALRSEWITSPPVYQVADAPQYWLTNRVAGVRRAMVTALGNDGSCSALIVEEHQGNLPAPGVDRPLGDLAAGLFALNADSLAGLGAKLTELKQLAAQYHDECCDQLARRWYRNHPPPTDVSLCLTLVIETPAELNAQLDQVARHLERLAVDKSLRFADLLSPAQRERVFFSADPLATQGKIAFIFPGSGNHFAGMGRDLAARWPEVYGAQEAANSCLADQYQPHLFWKSALSDALLEDHNALVISHVSLCTALHDLLSRFAIRPQMVSGYSLGESSGLFSTGAWRERDAMLQRLKDSPLFTSELAGECHAARRTWGLPPGQQVDWCLGIVNVSADQVKKILAGKKQVYLLIVNTYKECVIGGRRRQVDLAVKELGCHFIPLQGVTTVHCEVTRAVADAYRNLHLFDVRAPRGIDFYSCAFGGKYPLTTTNAADAILAQALDTIDYPRVIERLYADGARIFLEVGPGSSCTRMISSILGERPHLARSFCVAGQDASVQFLRLLGHCLAEGVKLDLSPLYPADKGELPVSTGRSPQIVTTTGGAAFAPTLPVTNNPAPRVDLPPAATANEAPGLPPAPQQLPVALQAVTHEDSVPAQLTIGFRDVHTAGAAAHAAFLELSADLERSLAEQIGYQQALLQQADGTLFDLDQSFFHQDPYRDQSSPPLAQGAALEPEGKGGTPVFDRQQCMEFAVGSVAGMLGQEFAEVDTFPTRVRLPDEPLMLVDRIVALEGEPRSMSCGRVITEHDVTADRWYLDGGRIPTCVAVEAGQADLFLSGYLGIDFITRGLAVYRLLDAVVTFHRGLPTVGETIQYDIHIDRFFRQDQTYLFRFHFEATVNGEPLLSMRDGCAGFFSAAELAAGKGIVHTRLDLLPQPGRMPADWRQLVPMAVESYNDTQVAALYAGDLAGCFGPCFADLPLNRPYTLPGGKLKLVDRVIVLDPEGGRYGLGQIRAEMDIQPDAWFLTCHFVDDRVMPGTLMYECCMHTLRIYLLRMGWIGENGATWCEPVPGVQSGLKCRGQVIETTKKVTYQVSIKELGYRPEPYAIVDALMFADDHPIVEIPDMSVRLSGLDRSRVEALWQRQSSSVNHQDRQVLYDRERITAFAVGNPSDAFGEPYRMFDQERKIARLPGPPFQFLDRIVDVKGQPWKLVEGAAVVAEYDVPPDAWYFTAGRQPEMPFSVLLEIGLQPCGWLAAYLGSALTSDTDLSFRNLDGQATQHKAVTPTSGTLTIKVEITRIASSGGMIIQGYTFNVHDSDGPIYTGTTVFGFFSAAALAQQVGVRGVTSWQPPPEQIGRAGTFEYPVAPPFPDTMLRMVDTIDLYLPDGGPHQRGFIRGSKIVDPDEWFFKAHFYQDPVCPGSLGLESFLQLLKVVAAERWGLSADSRFETMALGVDHRWNYRGQIIPTNQRVEIEALITAVDDQNRTLKADGLLSVDGKIIYQMKDFALRLHG